MRDKPHVGADRTQRPEAPEFDAELSAVHALYYIGAAVGCGLHSRDTGYTDACLFCVHV